MISLSDEQHAAAHFATGAHFLYGPAGTGKTTAAVARLLHLLDDAGVPGSEILVLVPQRTLALPFYDALNAPDRPPGAPVMVSTLGGLAQRAVELFWPLVAEAHGFADPALRPVFLSLEAAQYYMARVVGPLIEREGYFETVTIDRARLYSQLVDNLNKAAVIGFPHTEIGARLKEAWIGDDVQRRMYDDAQACADAFRAYCLQNNLLDFSLQIEVFMRRLLSMDQVRQTLLGDYRHIIADNIEEDTPAAHTVVVSLLNTTDSALLICDTEAGYRRFLGADPENAEALHKLCDQHTECTHSFVTTPPVRALAQVMGAALSHADTGAEPPAVDMVKQALSYDDYRYHPQMVEGVAERVADLVHNQGVPPGEIVVLAPYLSDALRFSLMNRLDALDVPARSHRPSRALREEPAVRCLLTLTRLAHPGWQSAPIVQADVIYALLHALAGIDLVRAQLLAQNVYLAGALRSPDEVKATAQPRITFEISERYRHLYDWLQHATTDDETPLDVFLSRLFGEVLSQPGFGFHDDFDAATAAANLIDSARKFRRIVEETGVTAAISPAQEYVEMVAQGVIADQYLRGWQLDQADAVLVAPAYTYLMSNRPVDYQFWLNVGGAGWSERLYQPLTNPYVLRQSWTRGRQWTDADEQLVNREALYRLVLGLLRRCRQQVYLGYSQLGEQGYEQRGDLLLALQRVLVGLQAVD